MTAMHSCYTGKIFNGPHALADTVAACVAAIEEEGIEVDAIACRGVSGLAVAAPVAAALRLQLIFVRKSTSGSHADFKVEGMPDLDFKYLIIDDFVCSGGTLVAIRDAIEGRDDDDFDPEAESECVGLLTYHYQVNFEPDVFNNPRVKREAERVEEEREKERAERIEEQRRRRERIRELERKQARREGASEAS